MIPDPPTPPGQNCAASSPPAANGSPTDGAGLDAAYARLRRIAGKRGGGRRPVRLDDLNDLERTLARYGGGPAETAGAFDWSALHDALELLRQVDARRHDVIVLRFFAGLDNRQIARQLGVDERTVGRDFAAARLWLKERLSRAG